MFLGNLPIRYTHKLNPPSSKYVIGYGYLVNSSKNTGIIRYKISQFNTNEVGKKFLYYEHDREECKYDIIFSENATIGEIAGVNFGNSLFGLVDLTWKFSLIRSLDPTGSKGYEFQQYLLREKIAESEQDFSSGAGYWIQGINN